MRPVAWLVRELGGVPDSFRLQEMTAFVAGNDLESRADGEANSRGKRIPKTDAVHVLASRMDDEFAACLIAGQESIKNRKLHISSGGSDFGWSRKVAAFGRGFNKFTDEPAGDPTGSDLLDRGIRVIGKRGGNRGEVRFIGNGKMLKALANTPGTRRRMPIELFPAETGGERLCGLVVCAQLKRKADRPGGRVRFL